MKRQTIFHVANRLPRDGEYGRRVRMYELGGKTFSMDPAEDKYVSCIFRSYPSDIVDPGGRENRQKQIKEWISKNV